jgi:hypothetical protein
MTLIQWTIRIPSALRWCCGCKHWAARRAAMRVRNAIVKWLGLKDLGGMAQIDRNRPLSDYRLGERVGIVTVLYLSDEEVVMGDDDKHLDVQVSLLKTVEGKVVVSTVVHLHNALGRIYMFFVKPAHRIIAPRVLAGIGSGTP